LLNCRRKVIELRQQAGDHSGSQQPYLTIIFDEVGVVQGGMMVCSLKSLQ
jgi:hypothetical protein